MLYQLTNGECVLRTADNIYIPPIPSNIDYQAYLAWVAEGNVPEPASNSPSPEPPNLTGLRGEISYGNRYPLVQDWYDGLLPRQRDPLQMAIANQELGDIEYCLLSILPTDEATLKQLKALLIEFKVPINL